jgi:hypothetical protein
MRKTNKGKNYEHEITGLFAATYRGKGVNVKAFIKELETEIEKCKGKGMKGPIKIQAINGGIFDDKLLLTGKA